MDLTLSIDFSLLCDEVFPRINSISPTPLEAILRDEFLRQLSQSATSQIANEIPKVRVTGWPRWYVYSQKVQSFADILSRDWFAPLDDPYDYNTGIFLDVHTDKAIHDVCVSVAAPLRIHDDTSQLWKYKRTEQKRFTKHTQRMHLNYPARVYESFQAPHCNCQTSLFISNPEWGVLDFQCRFCGRHYFCSCCEALYQNYWRTDCDTYSNHQFRHNLCHLCRGVSPEFCGFTETALSFYEMFAPYIQLEDLRAGHAMPTPDSKKYLRNAENRLRVKYGYPKIGEGWVNETYLLNTIKNLYPRIKVIHQGSPPWLGLQRFDVWLPDINVAIEYQGKQHFEPIEHFGGTEGFQKSQERDAKKKKLAIQNDVTIVYFSYEEDLTPDLIKNRLIQVMGNQTIT